jgi:hypothetical protein
MKASSTLVVDKDGKAVHAAGLYTAPRHPLALMAVNLEGAATVFELAPTEALEIGRHLFEAAGMTPEDWRLAASWCAEHARPRDAEVN